MPVKNDREYRFFSDVKIEQKAEGDARSYMVEGYASTFAPYEMLEIDGVKYYERIDRNAFDSTDMSDVVFLRDHAGRVLARSKNGRIQLSVDDHGLHTRTDLSSTAAAREMVEDIEAGNYTQMSFSFTVGADHFDKETRTRVIDKVSKLYDISAVAFPANPGTDIGISFRDQINGAIEMERAERLEAERKERERAEAKKKLQLKLTLELERSK